MKDKVLVNIYIPFLEKKFEVFLPIGKKVSEITYLIGNSLTEITGGYYVYQKNERLYNRLNGKEYNANEILKYTTIRNGAELVLM